MISKIIGGIVLFFIIGIGVSMYHDSSPERAEKVDSIVGGIENRIDSIESDTEIIEHGEKVADKGINLIDDILEKFD